MGTFLCKQYEQTFPFSLLFVYFSFTSSSLQNAFFIVRNECFKMPFKLTMLHTFVEIDGMKQTREREKNSSWGNKKISFDTSCCDKSQIKNIYVKLQWKTSTSVISNNKLHIIDNKQSRI